MELKNWILTGLVTFLVLLLGYVLKSIADRTLMRLDAILDELRNLNTMLTRHEEELSGIHETLKDHEARLRFMERND